MKVLIVSATLMEVRLIADEFSFSKGKSTILKNYRFNNTDADILISGIGTTFTTFNLLNTLKDEVYGLVLNTGIAGSFSKKLKIGEAVNVVSEEFADLGIEKPNSFLTLFDSGFIAPGEFPFESGVIRNEKAGLIPWLPEVKGITVNKSNGRRESINELAAKFNPEVESMEGAAVFYVCKKMGVPFLEIRAISNYVEPRDNSKWDIPLALENLKNAVVKVLGEIK
jgi:futalosine hydrolase